MPILWWKNKKTSKDLKSQSYGDTEDALLILTPSCRWLAWHKIYVHTYYVLYMYRYRIIKHGYRLHFLPNTDIRKAQQAKLPKILDNIQNFQAIMADTPTDQPKGRT